MYRSPNRNEDTCNEYQNGGKNLILNLQRICLMFSATECLAHLKYCAIVQLAFARSP